MNRHRPIETLAVFLLLGSPIICLAEPTLSNVVIKIDNDTTLSAKAFWPYGDLETAEIRNNSNDTIITAGKVSHADGYLHSGSAIEISLQMPEEIGVSEFSCRGQVIGFTNHWPVLADVNFIFSADEKGEKLNVAAPYFVFSPTYVTNLVEVTVHRIYNPAPLGASAGLEFLIAQEQQLRKKDLTASAVRTEEGAETNRGHVLSEARDKDKATMKEDSGCLFLFRKLTGVFCKERITLGKDDVPDSIEKIFDLMGAASSNLSSKVSYEKIPIRSGDLAYFASDSQLARWREASTGEFKKGESLFTNICDNIFYSALSRQPPLFECREGALGIFKEIEVEKEREFFYFNLVFEGALIGDDVQTNKFSVEILPEDGEVECVRTSVFTRYDNKSYMIIVGCRRRLESLCFPLGRLYFTPFNHDLSYYDGRAIIFYEGKEVGARNFSLCTPHFLTVDLDIRNEFR